MLALASEFLVLLSDWTAGDTRIAVTGALAAMSCALVGNFLLVRRQSMMGDALSHTVLPGIVVAFLLAQWLVRADWITSELYGAWRHSIMFAGALVLGVFSAMLTEWVQRLGRVEAAAALGVVFTSLFALGLLLIRVYADTAHIDPDCVLFGAVETVYLERIPQAAITNGVVLLVNMALVLLFFKELRLCAFDAALASTLGFRPRLMHYGLMAVTAATLISAFETVGSILVIAMLIVPPATAYLLTDRFSWMIVWSLVVAASAAVLGHVFAITLPAMLFGRLGFAAVKDASTAGMMAASCGLLFVAAMFLGPRYGLLSRGLARVKLTFSIVCDDVLGEIYRLEDVLRI